MSVMRPTRQMQPYRQGAREPSSALDAMRLGKQGASPGAALMMAAGKKKQQAKKGQVMLPRWK